jgi:hypothetical protein
MTIRVLKAVLNNVKLENFRKDFFKNNLLYNNNNKKEGQWHRLKEIGKNLDIKMSIQQNNL